jgi:hypothetical protein
MSEPAPKNGRWEALGRTGQVAAFAAVVGILLLLAVLWAKAIGSE